MQKVGLQTVLVVQAVIEGYLRPMLADNWDKGSLYSYRAFSFPSDMPYEAITQPVLFITGEKDQPLTRGAQKVILTCVTARTQPLQLGLVWPEKPYPHQLTGRLPHAVYVMCWQQAVM